MENNKDKYAYEPDKDGDFYCEGHCPKCGSGDIEFDEENDKGDWIWFYGTCSKCKSNIRESYEKRYTHTVLDEDGEDTDGGND